MKLAEQLHDMTMGMMYWLSWLPVDASLGVPRPPSQSKGPQRTIISFHGSPNTHNSL